MASFNWDKRRPYGERLLRAAAKGEDTSKIKREEDPYYIAFDTAGKDLGGIYDELKSYQREYLNHIADAFAYGFTGYTGTRGTGGKTGEG